MLLPKWAGKLRYKQNKGFLLAENVGETVCYILSFRPLKCSSNDVRIVLQDDKIKEAVILSSCK